MQQMNPVNAIRHEAEPTLIIHSAHRQFGQRQAVSFAEGTLALSAGHQISERDNPIRQWLISEGADMAQRNL